MDRPPDQQGQPGLSPQAPALPVHETRSTCPYCGVGCGVIIGTDSGRERIVSVRGDPDHPANFGLLCSKGSALAMTTQPLRQQQARLSRPMQRTRDPLTGARGPAEAVDWDQALDGLADRFAAIIARHGPDAVAFYISGQLLTEDYFAFNKLARGLIGTHNIDSNSRLCMSSAVAAYKQTLGADAPPCSYEDLGLADCLFITGSNTAVAHPVLFRRIEQARARRPEMKIIVVDPRRTETAEQADLHLPILPGTDVALYNGMMHHLLWEGWVDRPFLDAHVNGLDALRSALRECTPAWAAGICGISREMVEQAARWFAQSHATLSLYCQGLNQASTGTARNAALINLHLLTGQIGKPGAGPFSLTGQPNAMGGREVGGMANLLPAHRRIDDAKDRAEAAALWGVRHLPTSPGLTAVELFDAVGEGRIKAVWIACTNPAHSLPDATRVAQALRKAECVVVQDAFQGTATAALADVLLPATTWGEKEGTVTNSERRISRVRAAVKPWGLARHDWAIVNDFAQRLQARMRPEDLAHLGPHWHFDYRQPEALWNEHRDSTAGTDLDITALSYAALDEPRQWPMPAGASAGLARLYEDGRFAHADGKARLVITPWRAPAERTDAQRPLALLTGRLRDQWHGMSRTGLLGQAFNHSPWPELEMHPDDLRRRALASGDWACLKTRRGAVVVQVRASERQRVGQCYMAMHWGPEFLAGRQAAGVNTVTQPAFDPDSRQPELKFSAADVAPLKSPSGLSLMAWAPEGQALRLRESVQALCSDMLASSAVLFAEDGREGVMLRAVSDQPVTPSQLAALRAACGIDAARSLSYHDARRQALREVTLEQGRLQAFLLVGDLASEGWLSESLRQGIDVSALRRALLLPGPVAPKGQICAGRAVCTCIGVRERSIEAVLAALPASVASEEDCLSVLKQQLSCGTQCGSCVPEIRAMIRQAPALRGRLHQESRDHVQ